MSQNPGWYPDPASRKHRRFWDGQQWTEHRTVTRATFWRRMAGWAGIPLGVFLVLGMVGALTSRTPSDSGTALAGPGAGRTSVAAPASAFPGSVATGTTPSPSTTVPTPSPERTQRSPAQPAAKAGTALAAAEALIVRGRAPQTGYDRDQFGSAWKDTDGNGCDQRDDVLNRDLSHKTFDGCTVLRGTLHDPYTGKTIHFRRGQATSSAVQIDHVVAESDAWQTGAQRWSATRRLRFATDTLNLYAVDGPTNESKGDGDTATWLPPNRSFRCTYVTHQVAVKKKYHLWVTSAERSAMVRVLSGCSTMRLPKRTAIPSHPAAQPEPATPPADGSGSDGSGSVGAGIVHPGAFCSPTGAIGVTAKGTPMVCTTTATDDRARWRSR